MKILWFSWKDITHPQAGGAEIVTHELLKRAVADGHEAVLITSRPQGSAETALIDGYRVIRAGNQWTVYWQARKSYLSQFRDWPDIVIDECNTIPFFACFYVKQPLRMFFHQLCREIWFYQMRWPFSWVGYMAEPIYLRLLNNAQVITVSQSTSIDLQRFGFKNHNIHIISEGIQIEPIDDLDSVKKYPHPTLLCLGAVRPMKRTMDVLRAFEMAKEKLPDLRLIVAGSDRGNYAKKVREACKRSPFSSSIDWVGKISEQEKIGLLREAHLVVVASIKEGWCLVVTEANSQGTPAVGYKVDGVRDSIEHLKTGWLADIGVESLSAILIKAFESESIYQDFRCAAWKLSKKINFDKSYEDFLLCVERES